MGGSRETFQRHGVSAVAVLVAGVVGVAAPGPAMAQSSLGDGLLMISDFMMPSKVRIMDPTTNRIVYDYVVDRDAHEACQGKAYCFSTGLEYRNHGGEDLLDIAITIHNQAAAEPADRYFSVVQRIKPSAGNEKIFELRHLDFTGIPNSAAHCIQNPMDPCGTPTDTRCQIAFAEGLRVIDENPAEETVTVLVAEGEGERVLQATLDYSNGNTCARVDWVLGDDNPDWPSSPTWPNGVDYLDRPGDGKYLLVDFFVSEWSSSGSQMHMFRQEGDVWELMWKFPEDQPGSLGYLNTPHMSKIMEHPITGETYIWYAHSRGDASTWQAPAQGYGSTWGALKAGDSLADPPTYLWELGFWDASGQSLVNFTRDQDYLPDGTMLLTDAACQNVCKNKAVLYHVDPDFEPMVPSGLAGYYTTDNRAQAFKQIPTEAVLGEYRCDLGALFEVLFVPTAELGSALLAAKRTARRPCPNR